MERKNPKKLQSQHSLTVPEVAGEEIKEASPVVIPIDDGAEDMEMEMPADTELLEFQKKRSTPAFRLSSVNLDEEEAVICDVQNFHELNDAHAVAQVGLLPSGVEDRVSNQALQELNSPTLKP